VSGARDRTSAYWSLKSRVLARPHGGEGFTRSDGAFRLIRAGLCERHGFAQAADAHHRLAVSQGGPDAVANLTALCRACHDWAHAHPREAAEGGWVVPPGTDFRGVPLSLWNGAVVLLDDEAGYLYQKWPTR
jgi:hypothetical protein